MRQLVFGLFAAGALLAMMPPAADAQLDRDASRNLMKMRAWQGNIEKTHRCRNVPVEKRYPNGRVETSFVRSCEKR